MPKAARSLLEALERYPADRREDRLTEVFAFGLAALPELAEWFVAQAVGDDEADLPVDRARFDVRTQLTTGGEGRPDLALTYRSRDDRELWILSEHKIDARYTAAQRSAYAGRTPVSRVLVARDIDDYRRQVRFDSYLTWRQVAAKLDEMGRAQLDSAPGANGAVSWRRVAHDDYDQPSRLFALAEILGFLERQGIGVTRMNPLTSQDVDTYADGANLRSALLQFFAFVRDHVRKHSLDPGPVETVKLKGYEDHWWMWLSGIEWPLLTQLAVLELTTEICLQPWAEWWLDDDRPTPALYAGFSFATPEREVPGGLKAPGVRSALEREGVEVALRSGGIQCKCQARLHLSEIVSHGVTLYDQAEYAANWAVNMLRRISLIGE